MPITVLPHTAAGVAIATAGVFAIGQSPLSLTQPDIDHPLASPAVQLTTTVNPIQAWVDVFQETQTNFGEVFDFWLADPFPIGSALLQNPLAVFDVVSLWNNYGSKPSDNSVSNLISPVPDYSGGTTPAYTARTLPLLNQGAVFSLGYTLLPSLIESFVNDGTLPAWVGPLTPVIVDLYQGLGSAISGAILGSVGVLVGPGLAIQNQFQEFVAEIQGGNILEAAYALINIPAAVTGAILNGGYDLDLTNLVNRLLPDSSPIAINDFKIPMAGIFSPPQVVPTAANNPNVTGSVFQSLILDATVPILGNLSLGGTVSGPVVSMQEFGRAIGEQIAPSTEAAAEGEEAEEAAASAVAEDTEAEDVIEDVVEDVDAEDLAAEDLDAELEAEDLAAEATEATEAEAAEADADDAGSETPRWRKALQRIGDRVFNRTGSDESTDSTDSADAGTDSDAGAAA